MIYGLVCGSICLGLVVLAVGFVIYANIADARKRRYVVENGSPAKGWLIQANMSLFEKGSMDLPALVLVSPNKRVEDDEEFMTDLAQRIMELKEVECDDEDEAFVSNLVTDELYVEGKMDRLPESFAGRHEVYAAHIFVYRDDLPGKRIRGRYLPCSIIWDEPGTMICTRPQHKADRYEDE